MPLKPVKRGIKKWMRCDPASGYTYFISIYCGKEDNSTGPLGERVVTNLVQTTKKPNVTFCFDRFFSGVELLEILGTPALGTVQTNRKYLPKFHDHNNRMVKLKPGESVTRVSTRVYFTLCGRTRRRWHYSPIVTFQLLVRQQRKRKIDKLRLEHAPVL